MSDDNTIQLSILLVEDDEENLNLLIESLPDQISSCQLVWDPCDSFDEAVQRIQERRYDLVVTDIYRDRTGVKKGIHSEDEWVRKIIDSIQQGRFCPIIVFTDGSAPQTFEKDQPFIKYADKSGGNEQIVERLEELLATEVLQLVRAIHEELDRTAGSYLWTFLNKHWSDLNAQGLSAPPIIERLIRRRASIQMSRLKPGTGNPKHLEEIKLVEGLEFYLYPSVAPDELRLGEIMRKKNTTDFRIILTPHCHMSIQPGDNNPRADYVLTAKTVQPEPLVSKKLKKAKTDPEKMNIIRRAIQSPADVGRPSGRYWFLPGFLDIPDLYCDFLQLESIEYEELRDSYESIAALDTPFAEALQSCFTRFYSAVGLPGLDNQRFGHWTRNNQQ
jgi:CheY-like chemotaxis protein